VLLKRLAADEERGRTLDLVSDESAPNRSVRTPWVLTNEWNDAFIKIKIIYFKCK
jgi:hypothetical protein